MFRPKFFDVFKKANEKAAWICVAALEKLVANMVMVDRQEALKKFIQSPNVLIWWGGA